MTNITLAQSYLRKAADRLDILDVLHRKGAYSDVIREAQKIVELACKGMLRSIGIEPPKFHDVGGLLQEHRDKLTRGVMERVDDIAAISKRLKKERELSFYGDIDFIPTEEYSLEDLKKTMENAHFVVTMAQKVVKYKKILEVSSL